MWRNSKTILSVPKPIDADVEQHGKKISSKEEQQVSDDQPNKCPQQFIYSFALMTSIRDTIVQGKQTDGCAQRADFATCCQGGTNIFDIDRGDMFGTNIVSQRPKLRSRIDSDQKEIHQAFFALLNKATPNKCALLVSQFLDEREKELEACTGRDLEILVELLLKRMYNPDYSQQANHLFDVFARIIHVDPHRMTNSKIIDAKKKLNDIVLAKCKAEFLMFFQHLWKKAVMSTEEVEELNEKEDKFRQTQKLNIKLLAHMFVTHAIEESIVEEVLCALLIGTKDEARVQRGCKEAIQSELFPFTTPHQLEFALELFILLLSLVATHVQSNPSSSIYKLFTLFESALRCLLKRAEQSGEQRIQLSPRIKFLASDFIEALASNDFSRYDKANETAKQLALAGARQLCALRPSAVATAITQQQEEDKSTEPPTAAKVDTGMREIIQLVNGRDDSGAQQPKITSVALLTLLVKCDQAIRDSCIVQWITRITSNHQYSDERCHAAVVFNTLLATNIVCSATALHLLLRKAAQSHIQSFLYEDCPQLFRWWIAMAQSSAAVPAAAVSFNVACTALLSELSAAAQSIFLDVAVMIRKAGAEIGESCSVLASLVKYVPSNSFLDADATDDHQWEDDVIEQYINSGIDDDEVRTFQMLVNGVPQNDIIRTLNSAVNTINQNHHSVCLGQLQQHDKRSTEECQEIVAFVKDVVGGCFAFSRFEPSHKLSAKVLEVLKATRKILFSHNKKMGKEQGINSSVEAEDIFLTAAYNTWINFGKDAPSAFQFFVASLVDGGSDSVFTVEQLERMKRTSTDEDFATELFASPPFTRRRLKPP